MVRGITWTHIQSILDTLRSFRGPLFCKPVTGQELFFAVSYSKPALVATSRGGVKIWPGTILWCSNKSIQKCLALFSSITPSINELILLKVCCKKLLSRNINHLQGFSLSYNEPSHFGAVSSIWGF